MAALVFWDPNCDPGRFKVMLNVMKLSRFGHIAACNLWKRHSLIHEIFICKLYPATLTHNSRAAEDAHTVTAVHQWPWSSSSIIIIGCVTGIENAIKWVDSLYIPFPILVLWLQLSKQLHAVQCDVSFWMCEKVNFQRLSRNSGPPTRVGEDHIILLGFFWYFNYTYASF
jgi:hypothetical protein